MRGDLAGTTRGTAHTLLIALSLSTMHTWWHAGYVNTAPPSSLKGNGAVWPHSPEHNLQYRHDLHATGWAAVVATRTRCEMTETGATSCWRHHSFAKAYYPAACGQRVHA